MKYFILIFFSIFLISNILADESITFTWTDPTEYTDGTPLPEEEIDSFRIICGESTGNYTNPLLDTLVANDVTSSTGIFVTNPLPPDQYYCIAKTIDTQGRVSDNSNETIKIIRGPIPNAPGISDIKPVAYTPPQYYFDLPETYFDGSNYIDTGLAIEDTIKVSFRIFPETSTNDHGRIFASADGTGRSNQDFMISLHSSDTLRVRVRRNGTTDTYYSTALVPKETWTEGVVEYDGEYLRIYLNNILDSEFLIPGVIESRGYPSWVGASPSTVGSPFTGFIELTVTK